VEDFIEDIEDAVGFHPRPGGMVERHRQQRAAREAAKQEALNESERIEEHTIKTVKVTVLSPEVVSAITITIAAGQYAQILPNSPYRYRATILVVTAAATVILAKDSSAALGQQGALWPAGTSLSVYSRAQLYAFNNTGAPLQVSVIAEIHAPEDT